MIYVHGWGWVHLSGDAACNADRNGQGAIIMPDLEKFPREMLVEIIKDLSAQYIDYENMVSQIQGIVGDN